MSKWDKRIDKAEKFLEKAHEHGRNVYKRYRDERSDDLRATKQRANVFYSNVNTLKESLFNSMPKPDVRRVQRGDFQDDISRVAADVVRRGLTYEIECAESFQESIESAILDRLVPGIGQVWVSFDVDNDEDDNPRLGTERIKIENVYWEDFLYPPHRKWSSMPWVARRLHLTKSEFIEEYGEDALMDAASSSLASNDGVTPEQINKDTYCVYEIWSKRDKKVYHIYKGAEEPLKEIEDPYKLKKFFPCPRPLIANVDTTSFLPVTDYHIAQDQYLQLDKTYCRIQLLVDAIKVAGLYDASNSNIKRMLTSEENVLIPVDAWAMHAERGGTRGQIDWFPVEQVSAVLKDLYGAFEATKAILYEITGMSDIVRGASNQYETAKAQQIKAQFASVRLNGYQRNVSIFVRDILRIMAEMFTQLYSDQKILKIIGQLPPGDMQFLPQAGMILRNDQLSSYKVDIQTNSLTEADWALEKQERMEVVQTVGQMLGQLLSGAQQNPEIVPLGVHLIKFAISGFRAGSELESYIDNQLDQLNQKAIQEAQNPKPPQPTADEKKAQAEMQKMQMDAQIKQQESQSKMQLDQQKASMDVQLKKLDLQYKQRLAEMDLQIKQLELSIKQQEASLRLGTKQAEAAISISRKQEESRISMESKEKESAAMESKENEGAEE